MNENDEVLPHIDSPCENCRWYLGDMECPAFATTIPDYIWNGEHKQVVKDQIIDIVFEENGPLI